MLIYVIFKSGRNMMQLIDTMIIREMYVPTGIRSVNHVIEINSPNKVVLLLDQL